MYEVELKVRADHESLEERLDDAGATHRESVTQIDTYYDAPHRDFAATDEALRLRRETPDNGETTTYVTYKGPLVESESKTRMEHQIEVEDGETAHAIFEALGFDSAATVEKRRDLYELADYTVVLDDVTGLGEFVEVETDAREADIEPAREGARDLLARLGLDPDEHVTTSYLGMLLADPGSSRSRDGGEDER